MTLSRTPHALPAWVLALTWIAAAIAFALAWRIAASSTKPLGDSLEDLVIVAAPAVALWVTLLYLDRRRLKVEGTGIIGAIPMRFALRGRLVCLLIAIWLAVTAWVEVVTVTEWWVIAATTISALLSLIGAVTGSLPRWFVDMLQRPVGR